MAGSATVTTTSVVNGQKTVQISWTSDASGAVNGVNIPLSGLLFGIITVPAAGGSAPTANYDIALTRPESSTLDLLQTLGANRSDTTAQEVIFSGPAGLTNGPPIYASGCFALSITNAGNTKQGTIYLKIAE